MSVFHGLGKGKIAATGNALDLLQCLHEPYKTKLHPGAGVAKHPERAHCNIGRRYGDNDSTFQIARK